MLPARHEVLRTYFPSVEGEPYQKVVAADQVLTIVPAAEAAGAGVADQLADPLADQFADRVAEAVAYKFDLSVGGAVPSVAVRGRAG